MPLPGLEEEVRREVEAAGLDAVLGQECGRLARSAAQVIDHATRPDCMRESPQEVAVQRFVSKFVSEVVGVFRCNRVIRGANCVGTLHSLHGRQVRGALRTCVSGSRSR